MRLLDKLLRKKEPIYEIPQDPYKEQREKFISDIGAVMSDESKEILEELLTHVAGEIEIEKYTFMLGYLRGVKDTMKEYEGDVN